MHSPIPSYVPPISLIQLIVAGGSIFALALVVYIAAWVWSNFIEFLENANDPNSEDEMEQYITQKYSDAKNLSDLFKK